MDGQDRAIGRYLRDRFRKKLGWEPGLPEDKLNAWKKEMSELYKAHFEAAPFTPQDSDKKMLLKEINKDYQTRIEAKFKLFNLHGAL